MAQAHLTRNISAAFAIYVMIILLSITQAVANDDQLLLGAGDSQTCLDNEFGCTGLDGDLQNTTEESSNVNVMLSGVLTMAEDTYTMNQLVLLASAPQRWWNASWTYRRRILLTEQEGQLLLDLHVPITIDTRQLILDGKLRSDCADIRVRAKNITSIPYRISNCNTNSTVINVSIDRLPAHRTKTLFIYYGNPSASDGGAILPIIGSEDLPAITQDVEETMGEGSIIRSEGDMDATGALLLSVEKNLSGTFTPIATVINDSEPDRTITSTGSLDLASLWNGTGWNTTLAGVGSYRVRAQFTNTSGILFDTSAQFMIVDELLTMNLTTPNNTVQTDSTMNITFTTVNYREISSCTIFYDDIPQNGSIAVDEFGAGETLISDIPARTVDILIRCTDADGNVVDADTRVTVVRSNSFGGNTTDLTAVNLSNIPDLVLEKPSAGRILFTQNVDLSAGGDLDQYVVIAPKSISIFSSFLSELNRSATLTFYGVTDITHPIVFVDDSVCSECTVLSFDDSALSVTVPHFSSYTVGPNARLDVSDTTDSHAENPGDTVTVIASYTNVTSNTSIAGAICTVTFNDTGLQAMTYNGSTQIHTYARTFNTTGVFMYTVQCGAAEYETLSATDHVSIGSGTADGPIAPVNINIIKSSRGEISHPLTHKDAQAGNTTNLMMNQTQITTTWQGLYGEIGGALELSTNDSKTFYNWSIVNANGEIYTSRAPDVNFATIQCGQDEHIAQEDAFLSTDGASDAVEKTFTQNSHPSFSTGMVNISSDSCRSTNVYTATGQDLGHYYQTFMVDGANNTIYTALLEPNSISFSNETADFEVLIPTRPDTIEPYYLWVEIN